MTFADSLLGTSFKQPRILMSGKHETTNFNLDGLACFCYFRH